MELKIIHLYPDLMSLYGSYANVALLRRHLTDLGHTVTVETAAPGRTPGLAGADFLFLGAGTERSQRAAMADLARLAPELRSAAADGVSMLFCGTAMELLGASVTDAGGNAFDGLGLAAFSSVQGRERLVGDVYGRTDLFDSPIVGYQNKCARISGVETPLLRECVMGFGNEAEHGPEGFRLGNVYASELTGPLLVKNPALLRLVVNGICARRGAALPETVPVYPFEEKSYAVTEQQLRLRAEKGGAAK